MAYPRPKGWVGSGANGSYIRQGSSGHEGWNQNIDNDIGDRRNAAANDGSYFSDYEVCEEY